MAHKRKSYLDLRRGVDAEAPTLKHITFRVCMSRKYGLATRKFVTEHAKCNKLQGIKTIEI